MLTDDNYRLYIGRMKKTPVERAIEAGGGITKVAKHFEVSLQAIQKWRQLSRVPADKVLELERLSGVSRHELRADIYPRESSAVAS